MNNLNICQATLLMGFCSEGPYRHAKDNLTNLDIKWINWGYNEAYVHPEVLDAIKSEKVTKGTRIVFCHWKLTKEREAKVLREGVIDHISYRGGYVSLTAFLAAQVSGSIDLDNKDHFLCKYTSADVSKLDASVDTGLS